MQASNKVLSGFLLVLGLIFLFVSIALKTLTFLIWVGVGAIVLGLILLVSRGLRRKV